MNEFTLLQKIIIWSLPVLFAITVHEVAHGWVAYRLGDPTAKMLGRLTLNPIKHIDPIGTILVPGLLLYLSNFIFGWAKPVPVTYQNLRNPRRDMALVAIAGPLANLLMAFGWGYLAKVGTLLNPGQHSYALLMVYMGVAGIQINLILMLLNSLPIPPLDGSRVLSAIVSPPIARALAQIEVYGFFILVALLASGVLSRILLPMFNYCFIWMRTIIGL